METIFDDSVAIELVTEEDILKVIPFFEGLFPGCNIQQEALTTKKLSIGCIMFIDNTEKLTGYRELMGFEEDHSGARKPDLKYTIIQGVPDITMSFLEKTMKLLDTMENKLTDKNN